MSDHTIAVICVFKIFFCVVLCTLATSSLISSASVKSMLFPSLLVPYLCMKCSLGVSNFLEEISSLSHLLFSFVSLH